ncbi:hypothetical protein QVD17_29811 [Tagetes erecta]|uniref:WRKY domain-containing protein n=1 Tax=Tagetes erecta TaxID=13708 RepID=A0AAD8K4E9_TARER|nr:hypothetical protein QVD17_29811 [Tagetes erecta]
MAVDFVGMQSIDHLNRIFQINNHDFSLSALNRSGHARFRRAPVSSSDPQAPSVSAQLEDKLINKCSVKTSVAVADVDVDADVATTASFRSMSCSVPEGSVSNGKQVCSLGIVAPTPSFSSRKPPLPSSHRKRSSVQGSGRENRSVSRTGCHCCKRRKTESKREVRRIPIIGSKVESIPADDYSWKKYGEKKIDRSPFPRVYYQCNSVKGCPARKCIELALTDSKTLVVTYYREHRHTPASLNGFNSLR